MLLFEKYGSLDTEKIVDLHFWVAPDAGTLMLSLQNLAGEKIDIDLTQILDIEIDPEIHLPGRIYINEKPIDLKSNEEKEVLLLLEQLIADQKLGHPQGLAAIRAAESIDFFNSDKAEKMYKTVSDLLNIN